METINYNPTNEKRNKQLNLQEDYSIKWLKNNKGKVYRFDLDHLPKYKKNEQPRLETFIEGTEEEYLKYIIKFYKNFPLLKDDYIELGKVESIEFLIKNNSIPKTKKFMEIIINAINWKLGFKKTDIGYISILGQKLFPDEDPGLFLDQETKQDIIDAQIMSGLIEGL